MGVPGVAESMVQEAGLSEELLRCCVRRVVVRAQLLVRSGLEDDEDGIT